MIQRASDRLVPQCSWVAPGVWKPPRASGRRHVRLRALRHVLRTCDPGRVPSQVQHEAIECLVEAFDVLPQRGLDGLGALSEYAVNEVIQRREA